MQISYRNASLIAKMRPFDFRLRLLLRNIFGSIASRGINMLISAMAIPLTINSLPPSDYAIFSMAISLSIFAGFTDLGLGLSLVNTISKAKTPRSVQIAKDSISTIWHMLLLIGAVGAIVCAICASAIANLNFQNAQVYLSLAISGICIFIGLPTGIVQHTLFAKQQSITANIWSTVGRILSLALIALAIATDFASLSVLILAALGVPTLVSWISFFYTFGSKQHRALSPKLGVFKSRLIGPYLSNGPKYLLLQMSPYFETGVDALIIGKFVGLLAIPAYDVYSKAFMYLVALFTLATMPIWPAISNARAGNDVAWVKKLQKMALYIATSTAFFIAIIFAVFSEIIVQAWTNQSLTVDLSILIGFVTYIGTSTASLVQATILTGRGQINILARMTGVYIIALILLKLTFVHYFGLAGIVWALVTCSLFRVYYLTTLVIKTEV